LKFLVGKVIRNQPRADARDRGGQDHATFETFEVERAVMLPMPA
jgi:hypothetical protein